MNYDEARPLADGSGWHWTSQNDGLSRMAWPCRRAADGVEFRFGGLSGARIGAGLPPMLTAMRNGSVVPDDEAWVTCEPHTTREEAERHYYDASLDAASEWDCSWTACEVPECPNPTQKMLGNMRLGRHFNATPLCDEHRTHEQLASLHPFAPGMQVIHS